MPLPRPDPLLRVSDLAVSFSQGGTDIVAVRTVGFAQHAGETLAILGESGSGKSILGAAIAGLLPPTARVSGSIAFDGDDVLRIDPRSRAHMLGRAIGFIPQSAGLSLNPLQTGFAQVEEVFSRVNGDSLVKARAHAEALWSALGLSPVDAKLHPHRLSGGMRQRVLVAMGLAANPRILIADEPTKGLDEKLRAETVTVFREIRRLRPRLALLIITHDLEIAEQLGDAVGVMYAGVLVEQADARLFFRSPRHPYSRGLLEASPARGMIPIPGKPPQPGDEATGCPFVSRCARASAICAAELPSNQSQEQRLLCHHPERPA